LESYLKAKLIYTQDGVCELKVVKGAAKDEYQMMGLSGATLPSNGVSNMINYWLGDEAYGPALKKIKEHVKNS
jgi:Na+-transporting NADH:ubiquinone oxidoreductase, subunit NqrC